MTEPKEKTIGKAKRAGVGATWTTIGTRKKRKRNPRCLGLLASAYTFAIKKNGKGPQPNEHSNNPSHIKKN